jgi:SAM-dependent MidA family methyltransferase
MNALAAEIDAMIAVEGPMSVARYMALCLGHPAHGYYMRRDPLGAQGDFVTAPEISQVYGELLGLWCVDTWSRMGSPTSFVLAELGPGRGTLMADMLRAARVVPNFAAAASLHLVETSPVLRERQRDTLAASGLTPRWHDSPETLPPGPAVIVANEFFDALPVRQFVRAVDGWRERLVGHDGEGRRIFGLSPDPAPGVEVEAPPGTVIEVGEAAYALAASLAGRISTQGGALLAVDYGHVRPGFGETFQAVRAHRPADPLAEPGEADLTAHVDFSALARAASRAGARVHGPVPQGEFLVALGARERAEVLARRAAPGQAEAVLSGVERLVGPGPAGMGDLFKVLAITAPDVAPAGFPPADPVQEPVP